MKYLALIAALIGIAGGPPAFAATTNLNYTAGQINSALGYALENSNTVARLDALDEASAATEMLITNLVVSASFSTASDTTYSALDLSAHISTNSIVLLQVTQTAGTTGTFRVRPSGGSAVYGGVGMAATSNSLPSTVIVSTAAGGIIECASANTVQIELKSIVQPAEVTP